MKVYVVTDNYGEFTDIVAVFDTIEKAKVYVYDHTELKSFNHIPEIEEFEVD